MRKYKKLLAGAAVVGLAVQTFFGCSVPGESPVIAQTSEVETAQSDHEKEETENVSEDFTTERSTESDTESETGDESSSVGQSKDGVPTEEVPEENEELTKQTETGSPKGEREDNGGANEMQTEAPSEWKWTLEECRQLFDMLEPSVWGLYWETYEGELRDSLSPAEFEALRVYVDKGQTEAAADYEYDRAAAEEAFRLQNEKRQEAGKPALRWSEEAYELAVSRIPQIARDFSHEGRPGGYGENLASGSAGDSAQVIERWFESENHRENMLNNSYTQGAIAHAGGLWVALFQ